MLKHDRVIPNIRAPKGFHWKIGNTDNNDILVELLNTNNQMVGEVILHLVADRPVKQFITHSWLLEDYHGKGYGTKIYARAIQWCLKRGYRVRSSGCSSLMAERVWKGTSLKKEFLIRKLDRWTWHAYAKRSK